MTDASLSEGRPFGAVVSENRFYILLAGLLAMILSAPVVDAFGARTDSLLPHYVMGGFFLLMLLAVVVAVCDNRRSLIIAVLLALPTAVFWAVDIGFHRTEITLSQLAFGMVFLSYAVLIILRFIFSGGIVSGNMIAASLCIYLLLAVIWAEAYSMVALLEPGAFLVTHTQDTGPFAMRIGGRGTSYALYFSLVTMTTLGYGDIVPTSLPARTMATTQAVTGQMYLAVLVARLVGMHIAHSAARRQSE